MSSSDPRNPPKPEHATRAELVVERERLLMERVTLERDIASIKEALDEAALDPSPDRRWVGEATGAIRAKRIRHRLVQIELKTLKRRIHEASQGDHAEARLNSAQSFVAQAKRILDAETVARIWAAVDAAKGTD